jgi:dihydroorotase
MELIRNAKKDGLKISCSVTPYHLFFTEEDLHDYNTLLKVFPPLRTKLDQLALYKGIEDGTIDCISSHHVPQDWDAKTIEFENAKAGIASIETSFATVQHLFPKLSDDRIAELFSLNARNIFKLDNTGIIEGATAELTFYNKTETTLLTQKDSKSKSANSPFWDIQLNGKIKGIFTKGKLHLA